MRKFWLHIALSCLCLVGVAGCGNGAYDSRLEAADSLLTLSVDSARAVLRTIDADRLSRADRAYYALLSTQAAYKSYDSIPSTATIDCAVDYFSSGSDREKLTRSLLYKGAVLEDLGNKTEAMRFYKLAETEADTSDYFNLGYVNLRMAEIYRNSFVGNQIDVVKYKIALNYFKKAKAQSYEIVCLDNIGGLYRITNMDSAYKYVQLHIDISRQLNDTVGICTGLETLSRALIVSKNYISAKQTALFSLKYGKKYNTNDVYYDLCRAYACIGKVDSSEFFLNMATPPKSINDTVTRYWALAELNYAKGEYKKSIRYKQKVDAISDSLKISSKRVDLIETDLLFDKEIEAQKTIMQKEHEMNMTLLIASLLIILLLLIIYIVIKIYQNRELEYSIHQIYNELERSKESLALKFKEHQELSFILQNHIKVIKQLLDSSFRNETNKDKFISDFKNIFNINKLSSSFWNNIQLYADSRYNNIISKIILKYPQLTQDEINFITLLCLDFSYIEITVCMGYSNYRYISIKGARIAKKMRIECSLTTFLNELKYDKLME